VEDVRDGGIFRVSSMEDWGSFVRVEVVSEEEEEAVEERAVVGE
jgi:hypothetical protein